MVHRPLLEKLRKTIFLTQVTSTARDIYQKIIPLCCFVERSSKHNSFLKLAMFSLCNISRKVLYEKQL